MEFCKSFIRSNRQYRDMFNYIHIDEKWFNLTRINQRLYLLPDEKEPERFYKSKRFITKVMFMAAVVRPRYDATRKQKFNGKIGIWLFVYKREAKRKSKNRAKETLETKVVKNFKYRRHTNHDD